MTILGASQSSPPTVAHPAVIEVNEANFEQEVIIRSKVVPVVIDLWAPWCGPCRTLGPILERLAKAAGGAWVLAKINVDENQRLAAMFRAQSIPLVVAVVGGKAVEQFAGAIPEGQVRQWLTRFVREPEPAADPLGELEALAEDDPASAAARYRVILAEDPAQDTVQFNLGRLLLLRGEAEGEHLLKSLPATSPFFARAQASLPLATWLATADQTPSAAGSPAVFALAAQAARQRNFASAIDGLLTLVMRDRAFADDGGRRMLLALFALLGDEHPLVGPARRKLANLLF